MKIVKNEHSLTEYFSKIELGEIIEYEDDIYLTIDDIDNFNAVNIIYLFVNVTQILNCGIWYAYISVSFVSQDIQARPLRHQ